MRKTRSTVAMNRANNKCLFNHKLFRRRLVENSFYFIIPPCITLLVSMCAYAIQLEGTEEFSFCRAFSSVRYDWVYNDVLLCILGIGALLLLGYLISFENDAEGYFEGISKLLCVFKISCFAIWAVLLGIAIVYKSKYIGTVKEDLVFFDIAEGCGLAICIFLQSISKPQDYLSL